MSDEFYQDNDEKLWVRKPGRVIKVGFPAEHGLSWSDVPPLAAPDQHEPGAKLDGTKADASLLFDFSRALGQVALVGTYGRVKYTRGGWLKVSDGVTRYTAALLRHLFKIGQGEKFDQDPYYDTPEGSQFKGRIRHRAQVAWNALAALELELREEEYNGNE